MQSLSRDVPIGSKASVVASESFALLGSADGAMSDMTGSVRSFLTSETLF
jgi:hypothetical protein